MKILTIDLRKLTHSGIGRYLKNIVPPLLPRIHADRIQLIGLPEEIASLGWLPQNVSILPDGSAPHSFHEQMWAFDHRIAPRHHQRRVLWVPHYNIPLLYRGTLVCTVHDTTPLDLQENFGRAKRMLAHLLLRAAARRSTAILTPSHFSRHRIIQSLPIQPSRVTVTPLAVDTHWPPRDQAPAPHIEEEPYLLFVGNLKNNKNLTALLHALLQMGSELPLLLVAGKTGGFRTADHQSQALAATLGSRVRLLGAVTDDELIALYRGAAALVMPSLHEGFGLPILEAMRYGCPVLCSNVTSLPEVAGDAALFFDPRDPQTIASTIRLVLQPEHAQRLSDAGIVHEAGFSYTEAIQTTADVLNAALDTP